MPDLEIELQEIIKSCGGTFFTLRANAEVLLEQSLRRLATIALFQERRIQFLASALAIEFPADLIGIPPAKLKPTANDNPPPVRSADADATEGDRQSPECDNVQTSEPAGIPALSGEPGPELPARRSGRSRKP